MPQRTYVWIAIALLVCLFAMNVYRAATQAITIDEAFTSQLYLSKDLHTILNNYDANNHVLFTLCSKWLVNHYGNSEFTIRLASVLGGMLYLVAVYLVCRLLFGAGWLLPSGVAMLCLNPFLVDYLSVGRGYGMGLGFWMYALYCCLRFQREDKSKYLVRAGFSLG
ncbi:MAG TPA: glycosyltransferase family 39 protein, partial [Bryobacteraceae bacterium]|nr:glycosyltransferase family 39 protein [Bryobacteraceae bacterium]